MSTWYGQLLAAGLLGGSLLLGPAPVRAAEAHAQQAATATKKESPYARYAREHAKSAERKPARVKPTFSGGHRAHMHARGRH